MIHWAGNIADLWSSLKVTVCMGFGIACNGAKIAALIANPLRWINRFCENYKNWISIKSRSQNSNRKEELLLCWTLYSTLYCSQFYWSSTALLMATIRLWTLMLINYVTYHMAIPIPFLRQARATSLYSRDSLGSATLSWPCIPFLISLIFSDPLFFRRSKTMPLSSLW